MMIFKIALFWWMRFERLSEGRLGYRHPESPMRRSED